MKKPTLRGNRVFLNLPPKEESKLIVDDNTKESLNKEMLKKMSRMEVHSVGDLVSDIKKGDFVLVEPEALQKSPIIDIEDETVLLVSPFNIILIW